MKGIVVGYGWRAVSRERIGTKAMGNTRYYNRIG
jgi:hypothetical protein